MSVNIGGGCCAPELDGDLVVLTELKSEEVAPDISAVRSTGFHLLLQRGGPVEIADWAREAGVEPGVIRSFVEEALSRGRIRLDPAGRLVGIAGLSVEPTSHRIEVGDRVRWTWCALDAIGVMGALRATGNVSSTDPLHRSPIEIEFHEGVPRTDVVLFVLGSLANLNAVEAWCPNVNFFGDPAAARSWAGARGLGGEVVSVAAIASGAAEAWRRVTDSAAGAAVPECAC